MLASVEEIHDLDSAGEVLIGEIPDPDRTVAEHDFLLGPTPATAPRFGVESQSELFGCFDAGGVGGGILVADRTAFLVGGGLGKDAAEFDFARVCRLTLDFARPALRLRLHHR